MRPKAFLLDLDGVITDTARYHFLAWKALCDKYGWHFTQTDNERLKGVSRVRSLEIILEINEQSDKFSEQQKVDIANEKNDMYVKLIRQITHADILPGMEQFLNDCRAADIKLAVASASRNASEILRLLGIDERFDYIADAAKVPNAKPAPDVFLICAQALGLENAECVGIEDAYAGIEAIHSAGMLSVGIDVAQAGDLQPDVSLQSTSEIDLNTLLEHFKIR